MNIDIPFYLMLYAEVHFRFFRFFPNLLFKREPEIIFDTVRRLDPNANLPIILMVNEYDRFPVTIREVTISSSQNGLTKILLSVTDLSPYRIVHPFDHSSHFFLFSIAADQFTEGDFFINGKVVLQNRKATRIVINDNLTGTSKLPLKVFKSAYFLPQTPLCAYGDLHAHSQFSKSHVEFGPPIGIIDNCAKASGLSFFAITDHSYDLSCSFDNYLLENDNGIWMLFLEEMKRIAATSKCVILPGEEISVQNRRGKIVHLCGIGISRFIPGNRDGGRRIKKIYAYSIADTVKEIENQNGIAFAAHPGARHGLMQSLFLHRGTWEAEDVSSTMKAFQIVNCGFTASYFRSRKLWIRLLLNGKKIALTAGNDAHGDFNRYRAIAAPFLSIYEGAERYFGQSRTGVYLFPEEVESTAHFSSCPAKQNAIIKAISQGRTFVSDGPFLDIIETEKTGRSIVSHTPLNQTEIKEATVTAISNPEFGPIHRIRIFRGWYNNLRESLVCLASPENSITFTFCKKIAIDWERGSGYIRAETETFDKNGIMHRAISSPCYLE